jgi:hypothetical protein
MGENGLGIILKFAFPETIKMPFILHVDKPFVYPHLIFW